MKRALFIRGGAMKGAYAVGVLRVFHEKLGVEYFDSIYSNSVGVFEQVFFAANQPDIMENTWCEYVHGRRLINIFNLFKRRPILDLDYLIQLFQSEKSLLNVEKMKRSKPDLFCIATEHSSGEPVLFDLKKEDVFQVMFATGAIPFLYPKKVFINNKRYHDGSLSIGKIFDQLITECINTGFSEIFVIANRKNATHYHDPRVFIIEPSHMPLRSNIDTNRDRILQTIQQGKDDALNFIKRVGT